MKTLIDRNALERHTIDKYNFKVLPMGGNVVESSASSVLMTATPPQDVETTAATPASPEPVAAASVSTASATSVEGPEVASPERDALVESLLKKADEMSSSVIKMQMKIEEMETAHQEALEVERTKAYEEGVEAGRAQSMEEGETARQAGAEQFALSVKALEERSGEFAVALEGVKQELIHAAVDIAKEVILLEVGERSAEIAGKMASQLISELQEASKITLRVNPVDHGPLSESLGSLERVEILSDSAVSPGGVVAISNAGNIDAEVMKRFERVKSAALSG